MPLFKKKDPAQTAPPVQFFNTLTNQKEEFVPLKKGVATMYTCGPTVYNYATIGNLRSYVFSDTIRRVLEYNDYSVKQIINITDVGHLVSDQDDGDDKMTVALKREGKPITIEAMKEVADFYTHAFTHELKELNIEKPSALPKATEHIAEQIAYIKTLDEKGYTYTTSDGVYFDTTMFTPYGALSHGKRDTEPDHSRIGENEEKRHPADFALWKFNQELGWDTPWGKGFPGWHIECTAMSTKYLGKQFDIHTGGQDHIDIHHNNEIAQTEAATGKKFVNYWLHNAFITIEGKKISKSLGNQILLRNIKDRGFSPLVYRYWLLTGHYRSPMNFTWEALEGAKSGLFRIHRHFIEQLGTKNGQVLGAYQTRFMEHLNNDLDTAGAVALIHELIKDESATKEDVRATILDFDQALGLGIAESSQRLVDNLSGKHSISVGDAPKKIQKLVSEREEARETKDWQKADELRNKIVAAGYEIKDTDAGTELMQPIKKT